MKNILRLFIPVTLLVIFSNCSNEQTGLLTNGWDDLPEILQHIQTPQFPDAVFDATGYGAMPDGSTDSHYAFNNAVIDCNEKGGGIVSVPPGVYLCNGPITLLSNVNFYLQDGAVIKFSTNPEHYLPVVLTRWEGVECFNYSPLIYAYEQTNIAVTGKGIFDAQASEENWWAWTNWSPAGKVNREPGQSDGNSRPLLMEMNLTDVALADRQFGAGRYLRPNFIQPYKCNNILIEGVTFLDSPMWFIHPVLCENITVKNVTTKSIGPNTDGCNPESCKNVLIKGCNFSNGDDCIAIKSGRNNDGRRLAKPSENIIVQDCKMNDGHGGVVMGSEISGGVKNVFVENCVMDSPDLDRAIRLKSNTYRGGTIENVFVRNIKIGEVRETVLKINMKYAPHEGPGGEFLPVIKNIFLENITSKKSEHALVLDGLENSKIENIFIKDCSFDGVENKSILNHVDRLELSNVYINGKLQ